MSILCGFSNNFLHTTAKCSMVIQYHRKSSRRKDVHKTKIRKDKPMGMSRGQGYLTIPFYYSYMLNMLINIIEILHKDVFYLYYLACLYRYRFI